MIAGLDDGTVVKSVAFGRTLTDAIKGYGHMRQTPHRIRADCGSARTAHGYVNPPPDYRRSLNVPWRGALGVPVFFRAFSPVPVPPPAGVRLPGPEPPGAARCPPPTARDALGAPP